MDAEPVSDARVIVNGEPVEGVDPLFVGPLAAARDYVASLDPAQRGEVSIVTDGAVYDGSMVSPEG